MIISGRTAEVARDDHAYLIRELSIDTCGLRLSYPAGAGSCGISPRRQLIAVDFNDIIIFVHSFVAPEIVLIQHRRVDYVLTLLFLGFGDFLLLLQSPSCR
jgi:hypothetical protein